MRRFFIDADFFKKPFLQGASPAQGVEFRLLNELALGDDSHMRTQFFNDIENVGCQKYRGAAAGYSPSACRESRAT